MALFGGLFNSSSNSKTESRSNTFTNVDNSTGDGGGLKNMNLALDGDNNQVTNNFSDFGAIDGALDLARSSIDNIAALSSQFADDNANLAQDAAQNGSEKVLSSSTMLIGVVLVGGAIIAFAARKKS